MKQSIMLGMMLAVALSAGPVQAQGTNPTRSVPPAASGDTAHGSLLGRDVFSQDQTLMGQVEQVATGPDGAVQAIYIRTGGFLGFGTRMVAIANDKFQMRGQNVQLHLTSEDVQKLPEVKGIS